MKNITNWKTTIPTLAGILASTLGLLGVIDMDIIPQANELLTVMGISILTFIGLFSKA